MKSTYIHKHYEKFIVYYKNSRTAKTNFVTCSSISPELNLELVNRTEQLSPLSYMKRKKLHLLTSLDQSKIYLKF